MKTLSFLLLLFSFPVLGNSQNKGIRILPEIGASIPLGEFKEVNVFAKKGLQFGLNLDKLWRNFGFGLYGGLDKNEARFVDLLPSNNSELNILKTSNITQDSWKKFLIGIGPIIKMDISKKISFEVSSKAGFAKFSYPDFLQSIELTEPIEENYNLYQTKNEAIEKKLNPMVLSALRFNVKPTKRLGLTLSAKYNHVRNVLHSYQYLDANLNTELSGEELIQNLGTASTVTEIRKCHFNSFVVSIGISLQLGGREKTDPQEPPQIGSFQFYHLSTQNSGNYLPIAQQLKFILPEYLELGGDVHATIFNQRKEDVLKIEGLRPGGAGKNHTADDQGRVTIDLKQFAKGYYLLEVQNERNKKYFLRFKKTTTNGPTRK